MWAYACKISGMEDVHGAHIVQHTSVPCYNEKAVFNVVDCSSIWFLPSDFELIGDVLAMLDWGSGLPQAAE